MLIPFLSLPVDREPPAHPGRGTPREVSPPDDWGSIARFSKRFGSERVTVLPIVHTPIRHAATTMGLFFAIPASGSHLHELALVPAI
eukprot:7871761-Pyramimonas_sp.AAC.1